MPARYHPLITGHYYHVYNRGVAKMPVFENKRDYARFLMTMDYYRLDDPPLKYSHLMQMPIKDRCLRLEEHKAKHPKLIDIFSYTLMPNHIHLLVRQDIDDGISEFCGLLFNSYNKYFNMKHERVGPLFQGNFKAERITCQEQLLHVIRYIHLNPVTAYMIEMDKLEKFPWSSYKDYVSSSASFIDKQEILVNFPSINDFRKFHADHSDYARRLKDLEKVMIDSPEE